MSARNSLLIREAVGVFKSVSQMETAIEDLQEHGFDRASISLLGASRGDGADVSWEAAETRSLEDSADALRTAHVSSESIGAAKGAVIGGMLAISAIFAAGLSISADASLARTMGYTAVAGSAAALVGYVVARRIESRHDQSLREQLDRGGLPVWVRTRDSREERTAVDVLRRNGALDVHLHDLAV